MTRIDVQSLKVALPFKAGQLPAVDPARPEILLCLSEGVEILARLNPKACRKLATWPGGAVLQGRLVLEGGRSLVLAEAGFSFLPAVDPKPAEAPGEGPG